MKDLRPGDVKAIIPNTRGEELFCFFLAPTDVFPNFLLLAFLFLGLLICWDFVDLMEQNEDLTGLVVPLHALNC